MSWAGSWECDRKQDPSFSCWLRVQPGWQEARRLVSTRRMSVRWGGAPVGMWMRIQLLRTCHYNLHVCSNNRAIPTGVSLKEVRQSLKGQLYQERRWEQTRLSRGEASILHTSKPLGRKDLDGAKTLRTIKDKLRWKATFPHRDDSSIYCWEAENWQTSWGLLLSHWNSQGPSVKSVKRSLNSL